MLFLLHTLQFSELYTKLAHIWIYVGAVWRHRVSGLAQVSSWVELN